MARRVLLVPFLDGIYGRQILAGIQRYARPTRPWALRMNRQNDTHVRQAKTWKPDGVIVHAAWPRLAEAVLELDVPAINTSDMQDDVGIPTVHVDNVAVGRLAAQHLIERRFVCFGIIGGGKAGYPRDRAEGFISTVKAAGFDCRRYESPPRAPRLPADMLARDEHLAHWLSELPKPAAVFCIVDDAAVAVSDLAMQHGIAVPEDLAILGCNNDALLCQLGLPPISSVELPGEQVGYEAAAALERMMRGEPPPDPPIVLQPTRVVTRRSTDTVAADDPDVIRALRYIREHAHERINVEDVVRTMQISRSTLERRFTHLLGRSPLAEIQRVQVEHARHFLAETDLPMPRVAAAAGFRDNQHLATVFRRLAGMTPTAFRAKVRASVGL